jgi:calcineurin-like phosphoesterase family protein
MIEMHRHNFQHNPLSFWAIGDLHYRAISAWNEFHARRLAPMFDDLHDIWEREGKPAFCVSPGDLVETCASADYQIAHTTLLQQMAEVPFYPGVGNHEYFCLHSEDAAHLEERFQTVWGYPVRYHWQAGDFVCIMLDYPNPSTLANPEQVYISQETLTFLDETLATNAAHPAIIFLHCPLRDTVLARNPIDDSDFSSTQPFFSPENSQEMRAILARYKNACLFLSGHTHSGWEAPNLVKTEQVGNHPITFVNLMSPWYTGAHRHIELDPDTQSLSYTPDNPDVVPSFAVHIENNQATIRIREHLSQRWLKTWECPCFN